MINSKALALGLRNMAGLMSSSFEPSACLMSSSPRHDHSSCSSSCCCRAAAEVPMLRCPLMPLAVIHACQQLQGMLRHTAVVASCAINVLSLSD
jgi:hypothetical protein